MEDEKKKALRMYRFWKNRLAALGVNAVNVNGTEKEEAEKRNIPPTPPIKRKGEEEKDDIYTKSARAREGAPSDDHLREGAPSDDHLGDLFQDSPSQSIPTLEQAKSHAAVLVTGSTPAMVEEWFADCQASNWRDRDNQPIRNWGNHLNKFVRNYAYYAKLRDPDRIYDCRKAAEPKVDPAVAAREKRAKEIADDLRRRGLL